MAAYGAACVGLILGERRIPAVLGVVGAKQSLHDGQLLSIDGTSGTVQPVPARE